MRPLSRGRCHPAKSRAGAGTSSPGLNGTACAASRWRRVSTCRIDDRVSASGWLVAQAVRRSTRLHGPAAKRARDSPGALTTHVFDRTGEHLLYPLADEPRYLIAIGAVPKRMGDGPIARPAPNFGAMDLQRGSAPHDESCSRELDSAWRGSTSHLR